ncbi:hypothetical protein [Rhizobium lusitanum]|nr:hypothetical protein [Rhizobium lusitanum]
MTEIQGHIAELQPDEGPSRIALKSLKHGFTPMISSAFPAEQRIGSRAGMRKAARLRMSAIQTGADMLEVFRFGELPCGNITSVEISLESLVVVNPNEE